MYRSSTGFLKVTFTSDGSGTNRGFNGKWSVDSHHREHPNYDSSGYLCFNGTDTADCSQAKSKTTDSGSEFSASGRHLSDTSLVVLLGAASEMCQITHTNVRAERFSSVLFTVSLFSYFQLGSPSVEGHRAFLDDGSRGINMSSTARAHRRSATTYKVETSGGAVWWYQEGAIMLLDPRVGATVCTICSAGTFSEAGDSTMCSGSACVAGSYGPAGSTSAADATCTLCPAGQYSTAQGELFRILMMTIMM